MAVLHTLREKSDTTKKHVAVLGASVVTALIAVLWVQTLSVQFETIAQDEPKVERKQQSLSEIVEDARTQLGSVGSAFEEKEEPTVTPVRIKTTESAKPAVVGVRTVRIATTTKSVNEAE